MQDKYSCQTKKASRIPSLFLPFVDWPTYSSVVDLLIPAAGYATRMNGCPKFLLPINLLGESLLTNHIRLAEPYYENIFIAIRPEFNALVDIKKLSHKVQIIETSTNSMTETVLELFENSSAERFGLIMPDTYFLGDNPHLSFFSTQAKVSVASWKIRSEQRGKLGQLEIINSQILAIEDKNPNCHFENAWGAMNFTRHFIEYLKPESPHIGYGLKEYLSNGLPHSVIQMQGEYYDCGTPSEYFDLVAKLVF
jgi:GTP:adenosylcobinamide-phosphate guanylyltransferase